MMKKILAICMLGTLTGLAFGQDPTSINPNNGEANISLSWLNNVSRLRVGGSIPGAENGMDFQGPGDVSFMRLLGNGNVGIGTTNPDKKLTIDGEIGFFRNVTSPTNVSVGFINYNNGLTIGNVSVSDPIRIQTNSTDRMIIQNNGNVGIGTTNTGSHKLAVEGSIGAREIKVEASGWSDFVFENDYELRTLEEVEQHINENGHLPEIPSETEVTENGINLGEMNAKLLQKIEELTLYLIEQNKELKSANQKIEELQKEVSALKNE